MKKTYYLTALIVIVTLINVTIFVFNNSKDSEKELFLNYLSQVKYISDSDDSFVPKIIYFNSQEVNIKYEDKKIIINNYKKMKTFIPDKYCNKEFNHNYRRNHEVLKYLITTECKNNDLYIQISKQ